VADLKDIDDALTQFVRPHTFPVAVKMCESEEELPEKTRIPQRDLGITVSLCHALTMSRRYGWALAVDKYQSCYVAGLSMGFLPTLPDVVDGSYQESLGLRNMSKDQSAAFIQNMPKFEYGKYKYVLMAPLNKAAFEPDAVLTYGNPAQIWILLSGYLSGTGKQAGLQVTLNTGSSCTNHITRTIQNNEAQFALVGTGERLVPHPQDYECAFSIPMGKMEQTIKGLEMGHKTGIFRYPIPGFLRYDSQHPPGYKEMRSHLLGEET